MDIIAQREPLIINVHNKHVGSGDQLSRRKLTSVRHSFKSNLWYSDLGRHRCGYRAPDTNRKELPNSKRWIIVD